MTDNTFMRDDSTLTIDRQAHIREALEKAGIDAARWGPARPAALSPDENALYSWLLERFAQGEPPDSEQIQQWSATSGIDATAALERLTELDFIQWESPEGDVTVIYPFNRRPTPHRVWLGQPEPVHAMCAVDALGMAFMLGRDTTVRSEDGWSGEPVEITVQADGQARWEAPEGRVLVGTVAGEGSVASCCCPIMQFFTTEDNAQAFIEREGVREATLFTFDEALDAGRLLFEGLLQR